jgi:hypothetical protein
MVDTSILIFPFLVGLSAQREILLLQITQTIEKQREVIQSEIGKRAE